MSNQYEAALQPQGREITVEESTVLFAVRDVLVASRNAVIDRTVIECSMLELHNNIEARLPDVQQKVIQFTSSRVGEGVSTIVRQYAWVATAKLGKSVLIIDGDGGQKDYFHIRNKSGWNDGERNIDGLVSRVGSTNLYVSGYPSRSPGTSTKAGSQQITDILKKMREQFDLILIDSPPNTVALTRSVDGVILVVEAEESRWPVVNKTKEKILYNGGNILGIVFNKRKHYIPNWLYKLMK